MSTECIRTRTLDRRPCQSQDLQGTETGNKSKHRNNAHHRDKPEHQNKEDIKKDIFPVKNEGQDQHLDTTSKVFQKILNNTHKGNSLYSKAPSLFDPPVDDGGLGGGGGGVKQRSKIEDDDRLMKRFRWTSVTAGSGGQQRRRPSTGAPPSPASPIIQKLVPKNLSKKCSLFPSYLTDFEKEQLRLRQRVGHAVAGVPGQSHQEDGKSELERWCWKCSNSKLKITKRFEFFETRDGDHRICYFSIENTSSQPIAYKISSTRRKLFQILPSSTIYVPPGKTMNVSMTAGHGKFRLEDLENDEIIFESYFIPKDFALTCKTLDAKPSSLSSISVKTFFVHPCAVIPMRFNGHHSCPIIKSIPPPTPSKDAARLALLASRSHGERIFEDVQSKFAILYPQLRRLRRQNFFLSTFFNLISYSIFVGLLGYAVHLTSTFGSARLKESFLVTPPTEPPPDYSDSSQVVEWLYFHVKNSLLPVSKIFFHCVITVFFTFVQNPLTCCLNFLNFEK